jgi:hypothetical protein
MGLRVFGATVKSDCHVPGQEFFYPTEGMIGDSGQHFAEPAFRINAVEACRSQPGCFGITDVARVSRVSYCVSGEVDSTC